MRVISLVIIILTFAVVVQPGIVSASDDDKRVEHFKSEKPVDVQEALQWLEEGYVKIETALEKDQLQLIHKESYSLEAAVEVLGDHLEAHEAEVEVLEESIEIVHLASEEDGADEIRAELPNLRAHIDTVFQLVKG